MKRVFTTEDTNLITRVVKQHDLADQPKANWRDRSQLTKEDHTRARNLNSAKLKNDLRFIEKYGDADASQMDYIYNLKEYPSRIKKLFIKGDSKKEVPRQVLNIVTNSFRTRPKVFFNRFDMEFEEFATPKKDVTGGGGIVERVQKEQAQIREERDQAIAQVKVAETKRTQAEVRAQRAEVERDRVVRTNTRTHDARGKSEMPEGEE